MSEHEANGIARETQRKWRARRALRVALPTVAALGAGAAVAVATIPAGDGTITGCYLLTPGVGPIGDRYNEPYGALRVIDPSLPAAPAGGPDQARECEEGERQITWNQSGPSGPQGPMGTPGTAGPPGATGPPGSPLIGETSFGLTNAGATFLKLEGIKGESTEQGHKGEIDLDSFSLGANAGTGAFGGGGGAGKATIQSFKITKKLDKASPLLFQAAGSGRTIKEATVSFAKKSKGKSATYLEFKFTNVFVSSIADGTLSGKALPTEQVTFNFQRVAETLVGAKGKKLATVGFNVSANAKL
jgi:type VI secretion system secreted protein Hcp